MNDQTRSKDAHDPSDAGKDDELVIEKRVVGENESPNWKQEQAKAAKMGARVEVKAILRGDSGAIAEILQQGGEPVLQLSLGDFLTDLEIDAVRGAWQRFQEHRRTCSQEHEGVFAKGVAEMIIEPNIERINKALGKKMDPLFLGHAVAAVMEAADRFFGTGPAKKGPKRSKAERPPEAVN